MQGEIHDEQDQNKTSIYQKRNGFKPKLGMSSWTYLCIPFLGGSTGKEMRGEIISYIEMCNNEGVSLQKGMNFRLRGGHSVILMSLRPDAPYADRIEEDGLVLIYEGHDIARRRNGPDPKTQDQPEVLPSGKFTENGKFAAAVRDYKSGYQPPDVVRVYEKIRDGIWSDNGHFHLLDVWQEHDGMRKVFKFKLRVTEFPLVDAEILRPQGFAEPRQRLIPTSVKLDVWKRDKGKCTICGANDELHFDHILPFSRGGTSLKAENVQLLCARHNLQKSNKIE